LFFIFLSQITSFLLRAIIMAMTCSATELLLAVGVLTTLIPLLKTNSKSMLSRPIPWRPTTFKRSAASITSSYICELLMMMASMPLIDFTSSSLLVFFATKTSACSFKSLMPASSIFSDNNTFILSFHPPIAFPAKM
jgi:hypothetical protein